jgi:hypothetical protein
MPLRDVLAHVQGQREIRRRDVKQLRAHMNSVHLTRRHFLKVTTFASGALRIGFYIPESEAASIQPKPWASLPQGAWINA